MNRILVPTDFSPAALAALDYAVQLAARSGAEVIALHTIELPLPEYAVQPEGMQEYNQCRVAEARLRLEACYSCYLDANLRTVLVNGELRDAVPDKALQYDADLVVMGTRGAEGLRSLLGTNTSEVLARCPVPVLVVPGAYTGSLPRKMVLAVEHEENEFLLAPLFRLQALCGASLSTVHFADEELPTPRRAERAGELELLRSKWQQDFGTEVQVAEVISGKGFHEALDQYVREQGIDLVAMVTHRKSGLGGVFRKSDTRTQAIHTRVPLLSLHV
ncbi:universal stress protein [Flaviaesturariibacter terrae]